MILHIFSPKILVEIFKFSRKTPFFAENCRKSPKIVIMTSTPALLLLQVPVASWFDDMNDRELLDLIPFLEGLSKADSVYTVLQQSKGPGKPDVVVTSPVTSLTATTLPPTSPIASVTPINDANSVSLKKTSDSAIVEHSGTTNNVS
jgi:hypothetical protein